MVDVCLSMSLSFKKRLNNLETNSLSLSDQNVLFLCSDCIVTSV